MSKIESEGGLKACPVRAEVVFKDETGMLLGVDACPNRRTPAEDEGEKQAERQALAMKEEEREQDLVGFRHADCCDTCEHYFSKSDDNGDCRVYGFGTHSSGICEGWTSKPTADRDEGEKCLVCPVNPDTFDERNAVKESYKVRSLQGRCKLAQKQIASLKAKLAEDEGRWDNARVVQILDDFAIVAKAKADLRTKLAEKEKEVTRLSELLWGARCAYCGEVIGKECKNQDIGDAVLREHVQVCPKHPIAELKAKLKATQAVVEKYARHKPTCDLSACYMNPPRDIGCTCGYKAALARLEKENK